MISSIPNFSTMPNASAARPSTAAAPSTDSAQPQDSATLSTSTASQSTAATTSGSVKPKRSKFKCIAAAVAFTLAGFGVASALIPPSPVTLPATQTTLQKHVGYFDRNHDGQITMGETYKGLRALHVGVGRSMFSAFAINAALGPKTTSTWWSPTTIDMSRINFAKHGSDTGIIGPDGQFVQAKFDEMFAKWDPKGKGYLTEDQVIAMRGANKTDKAGSLGSKAEFDLLMDIAGETRVEDGKEVRVLTRDTMVALYDGSLFYKIAGEKVP